MLNFTFSSPTKIIFGKGAEAQVGENLRQYGKKALVHYGSGRVKSSGLYGKVMDSLKAAGVDVVELGGVVPNPRVELVREGVELCRREGVDVILAVGGGSVIDSCKAISIGVFYDGDVWDFYEGKVQAERALPIATVLTIPAAGSETSKNSVISNVSSGLKRGYASEILRPKFSVLNPELCYTLPPYQTACGAVDMLAHVFERYFSIEQEGDLTDRMCEAVMQSIVKNSLLAMEKPNEYAFRAELMLAGALAHNGLLDMGRTQEWTAHAMEHELSAVYDIAHGAGLAIVIPAWMKYCMEADVLRFAQFAQRVFGVEMDYFSPERTALEGITRMEQWLKRLGMPVRLEDAGIGSDKLEHMAKNCRKGNGDGTQGIFRPVGEGDIFRIFRLCV